jgi:hypothetical protein
VADSDPPLPRIPEDPESLRRLRREALRELQDEEELFARAPVYGTPPPPEDRGSAATVYGGPPPQERPTAATVYGGPAMGGGGQLTRRWTLKRILILLAAVLAGITAIFFGTRRPPAPVYGGPPIEPQPKENYPLYGGPPPRPRPTDQPPKKPHHSVPAGPNADSGPNSSNSPNSSNPPGPRPNPSAAAVYGGPPPHLPK